MIESLVRNWETRRTTIEWKTRSFHSFRIKLFCCCRRSAHSRYVLWKQNRQAECCRFVNGNTFENEREMPNAKSLWSKINSGDYGSLNGVISWKGSAGRKFLAPDRRLKKALKSQHDCIKTRSGLSWHFIKCCGLNGA